MKKLLWLVPIIVLMFSNVYAMDVTLEWDANTEPDLAGYQMFVGTASGNYGTPTTVNFSDDENPVPETVRYTVIGLDYGTRYYFAVKAFDTEGLYSGFSNEVSTDGVTGLPPMNPSTLVPKQIKAVRPDGTVITITFP